MPPKNGRSPLRSDVACETQQAPDLRSIPGTPPAGSRKATIPATGKGRELYDSYVKKAITELRGEVKAKKLPIKVSSKPATSDTIAKLRAAKLRALRAGK